MGSIRVLLWGGSRTKLGSIGVPMMVAITGSDYKDYRGVVTLRITTRVEGSQCLGRSLIPKRSL